MRYVFENCTLDPDRRELICGLETIGIGPQVFDVLLYLVKNRQRVVTKDDLLDAVWAGRIVSESTMTSHINAVRQAVGDSGRDQRVIRTIARKGFRFIAGVVEADPTDTIDQPGAEHVEPIMASTSSSNHSIGPSIAVMPFLNLTGDPEQEYFADGVVDDLISALSRIGWLFVIARNSSFTYRGRAVDVKQIGRELGVRYVLEGSVRKASSRVRVTGQLIDTTTGGHLWADRFEGSLEDVFELQDQITTQVVGAIAPQLERAEIERAKRKPTANLDAYDHYQRGIAKFHHGSKEAFSEALAMFYKAIELDPMFAAAYGMAAWCYFWRKFNHWATDTEHEATEGTRLAHLALQFGKNDDAVALTRGGHALAHLTGDIDSGISYLDKALLLNPNLAAALLLSGFLRLWRGELDEAIDRFTRATRLSPRDPELYRMQTGIAMAHLLAKRYDTAILWAQESLRETPNFMMTLTIMAASHALCGRKDEARQLMNNAHRLDPALRLCNLKDWLPFRRASDLALIADGLRKAGLPA